MIEPMLTTKEVAEILRIKEKSLINMRMKNQGPKWIKLGNKIIRYKESDVFNFINKETEND